MFIAKTIEEIREFLVREKSLGKKISLIPTMGALHQGHVSLLQEAAKFSQIKVVSIFVNKAQFNEDADFERYPRQTEADLEVLKKSGADCVFIPSHEEISAFKIISSDFPNNLDNCLCGTTRPGHFDGVKLIITKLFNIITPDFAFFGEKDFQQLAIIRKLADDLGSKAKVIGCKTWREKSGLAMSSRNQNLSAAGKIKAAAIFKILNEIKLDPKSLPEKREILLKMGFEKIDYLEIRDEKNLELITDFNAKIPARIFIAVYLEKIRLIDNLAL